MAKKDKAAEKPELCEKCDGTGSIAFGPICRKCDGTGKAMPVVQDDEPEAADVSEEGAPAAETEAE